MQETYGGPEVLELTEVPEPEVGPGTLRVRVHAASVNPFDWKLRAGYLRDFVSPTFPLVPGMDVAGVVDAVGPDVTEFAPGDEVVGYISQNGVPSGASAEMVVAPTDSFVPKPESVAFPQAAAVPQAGLSAAQALGPDGLNVTSGDTVLVHAAAGGVGTFAVQLARRMGARVLGTASAGNAEYLRSLGAEPVEYGDGLAERVRELAPDGVDAALDLVGGDAIEQSKELVSDPSRLASMVDPGVMAAGGKFIMTHPDPEQVTGLLQLVADGELHVEIAEVYPLAELGAAHDRVATGHVRGKVVVDLT